MTERRDSMIIREGDLGIEEHKELKRSFSFDYDNNNGYLDSLNPCPLMLNEDCEYSKDEAYSKACHGIDSFHYTECPFYQFRMNERDQGLIRISNPMEETVSISHDDILRGEKGIKHGYTEYVLEHKDQR